MSVLEEKEYAEAQKELWSLILKQFGEVEDFLYTIDTQINESIDLLSFAREGKVMPYRTVQMNNRDFDEMRMLYPIGGYGESLKQHKKAKIILSLPSFKVILEEIYNRYDPQDVPKEDRPLFHFAIARLKNRIGA